MCVGVCYNSSDLEFCFVSCCVLVLNLLGDSSVYVVWPLYGLLLYQTKIWSVQKMREIWFSVCTGGPMIEKASDLRQLFLPTFSMLKIRESQVHSTSELNSPPNLNQSLPTSDHENIQEPFQSIISVFAYLNRCYSVPSKIQKEFLNESVFLELFLETCPQVVIQIMNNQLSNTWNVSSMASIIFSGFLTVNHMYNMGYTVLVGKKIGKIATKMDLFLSSVNLDDFGTVSFDWNYLNPLQKWIVDTLIQDSKSPCYHHPNKDELIGHFWFVLQKQGVMNFTRFYQLAYLTEGSYEDLDEAWELKNTKDALRLHELLAFLIPLVPADKSNSLLSSVSSHPPENHMSWSSEEERMSHLQRVSDSIESRVFSSKVVKLLCSGILMNHTSSRLPVKKDLEMTHRYHMLNNEIREEVFRHVLEIHHSLLSKSFFSQDSSNVHSLFVSLEEGTNSIKNHSRRKHDLPSNRPHFSPSKSNLIDNLSLQNNMNSTPSLLHLLSNQSLLSPQHGMPSENGNSNQSSILLLNEIHSNNQINSLDEIQQIQKKHIKKQQFEEEEEEERDQDTFHIVMDSLENQNKEEEEEEEEISVSFGFHPKQNIQPSSSFSPSTLYDSTSFLPIEPEPSSLSPINNTTDKPSSSLLFQKNKQTRILPINIDSGEESETDFLARPLEFALGPMLQVWKVYQSLDKDKPVNDG